MLSERETTAAALSAGLQRLSSLQKEAQELQEERCRAEGDHQDLRPLRNRLRNCVEAEAKAAEEPLHEVLAASEGLFRRRASDLTLFPTYLFVEISVVAIKSELPACHIRT